MAQVLADLSLRISTNTALLQQGLDQAKAKLSSFKNQASNLGSSLKGVFSSAAGEISGSMNAMTGGMSGMLSAGVKTFKGLITGVKGFSAAFMATGIGAIIAVVVAALAGLVAAFKRSGSAADEMEKGLGFLKGIMNLLIGLLVKVGEWIVKAFKSDAASWFGEALLNVANRVQGLIQIFVNGWKAVINGAIGVGLAIKGIFNEEARKESKEYFAKMIEDLGKVGEGFNSMITGKPTEAMKEFTKAIGDTGNASKKIAEMEDALDERKRKVLVENAKLEIALNDTKVKIAEEDGKTVESRERKQKLLNDAIRQQNIISANTVSLAKQAWDIIVATNKANSDTSDEAMNKAAEAQVTYLNAQAAAKTAILNLTRKETGVDAALDAAKQKAAEEALKNAERLRKIKAENTVLEIADEQKAAEAKLAGERDEMLMQQTSAEEQGAIWTNYYLKMGKINEEFTKKKAETDKDKGLELLNSQLGDEKLHYEQKLKLIKDANAAGYLDDIKYGEQKRKLDEGERKRKFDDLKNNFEMASQFVDVLSTMQEAAKNRELAAAGDDEKRKEEIMKKYGRKQKSLAIAQALINGALAVTNLMANVPMSALNPATWVGIGIAAASTAAQIALIASQPLAKGGLAYGKTLATVGEYPGARSNPEVIAPLDKLKNLIKVNNMTGGPVEFILRGEDLYGSQEYHRKLKSA